MSIQPTAFYVIGLIVIWVLSEIRSNLSLIAQRLEWINQDTRKIVNKMEEKQ